MAVVMDSLRLDESNYDPTISSAASLHPKADSVASSRDARQDSRKKPWSTTTYTKQWYKYLNEQMSEEPSASRGRSGDRAEVITVSQLAVFHGIVCIKVPNTKWRK